MREKRNIASTHIEVRIDSQTCSPAPFQRRQDLLRKTVNSGMGWLVFGGVRPGVETDWQIESAGKVQREGNIFVVRDCIIQMAAVHNGNLFHNVKAEAKTFVPAIGATLFQSENVAIES